MMTELERELNMLVGIREIFMGANQWMWPDAVVYNTRGPWFESRLIEFYLEIFYDIWIEKAKMNKKKYDDEPKSVKTFFR